MKKKLKKKLKKLTKKQIKHVFEESEKNVTLRDFIRMSQDIFDEARNSGASVRDLHWISKKAFVVLVSYKNYEKET